MFVLKEVAIGSGLRLFGGVFCIWLPRRDIDYKPCVEVTAPGTLSLLVFRRLKWVFSLMNISFIKGDLDC